MKGMVMLSRDEIERTRKLGHYVGERHFNALCDLAISAHDERAAGVAEGLAMAAKACEELKRYRKKPVVIQAAQWFKIGDHAAVERPWSNKADYRCPNCGKGWGCHGVIKTLEDSQDGGHFVCPGDWIITGVQGENYACKPDIFDKTYGSEGEAADALERVTREEKSLRKYANERDQMCDILRDRAQAAEAEAERLRADAERYQHLRSERPTLLITGFFGNGCVNRTIEEVDAAIDAALEHK
jgi:hypothetical protein